MADGTSPPRAGRPRRGQEAQGVPLGSRATPLVHISYSRWLVHSALEVDHPVLRSPQAEVPPVLAVLQQVQQKRFIYQAHLVDIHRYDLPVQTAQC
jgi:hypothetical protein